MKFRDALRLALESLRANGFRSSLTILGMVIGVFSVIALVAVGTGAKRYVLGEFESLGTNMIVVQPGRADKRGAMGPPVGASQKAMKIEDVYALQKKALSLESVSGLILGTASVRYLDAVSYVNIFGANNHFPNILNLQVALGEYFSEEEDQFGRRVIVLGKNVASNLFGDENALGKKVKVNESEFRVIGILAEVGQKLGLNLDDFCFIPTVAALRLFNQDTLFGIRAKSSSRVSLDDAVAEITEILKERRDGEEDFTVVTQVALMDTLGTILDMLTGALAAIAAISMLVGGIGIMNMMLVSVSERTQEIGIRRAVGARRRDILLQFILEAFLLSLFSGSTGILLALGASNTASILLGNFNMNPPLWILPCSLMMAILVGVFGGAWPAYKASRIETLDALRHE